MKEIENKFQLSLDAENFLSLWTDFCAEHTKLYDITCEEYVHLLASDLEALESTIEIKNRQLEFITSIDSKRAELIQELDQYSLDSKVEKVSQVLSLLQANKLDKQALQLNKLNQLLLDIITKIQEQNKKNQFFLNKAILSLKDLKENFAGKQCYTTYGSNGAKRSNVTP